MYRLLERPAFEKGHYVPIRNMLLDMLSESEEFIGKRAARYLIWLQSSMKDDAMK